MLRLKKIEISHKDIKHCVSTTTNQNNEKI